MPHGPGSTPQPPQTVRGGSPADGCRPRLPEACKLACRLCLALSRFASTGAAQSLEGSGGCASLPGARSDGPTRCRHRGPGPDTSWSRAHTAGVAPPPHARVGVCHELPYCALTPRRPCGARMGRRMAFRAFGPGQLRGSASRTCVRAWSRGHPGTSHPARCTSTRRVWVGGPSACVAARPA